MHELGPEENREVFESIRNKLTNASDLDRELKTLYKVSNFSQFALNLLWISSQVEQDPSKLEPTAEDETLVLAAFQNALGVQEILAETPAEEISEGEPQAPVESSAPEVEQEMEPVGIGEMAGSVEDQAQRLAELMEKFVEAVQSGAGERDQLLQELLSFCAAIVVPESGAADDLREFAQLLIDFLQYISDNQILEDVRVMNITSNITDPVLQWAKASPDERAGLLEGGSSILRDFKSIFE